MKPIRWNDGTRWGDKNVRWGNPSYRLEPGDPGYIPDNPPPRPPMTNTRKFRGTLSGLLLAGDQILAAVTDSAYSAAMTARLGATVGADLTALLAAVREELRKQSGKTGDAGTMTQQQKDALQEVERLTAGARRTARLAFPGQDVVLRSEFQVGIDTPKSLAAELERAGLIAAACSKYATELAAQGWLASDTTELTAAIAACAGTETEQGDAVADRVEFTAELTRAANALNAELLRIQNAARLQYPSTKPNTEAARTRFLLNTFPPRDRSQPDGETPAPTPNPPTP